MYKIIMFVIIGTLFNSEVKSQEPCNRFPTKNKIKEKLSAKPVSDVSRYSFNLACNVNDSIKKRILYLLNWKWTEAEIEDYIDRDINKNEGFYNIRNKAKSIAKDNDSLYKVIYDSLRNNLAQQLKNGMGKNLFRVDAGLILTSAYLNLTDAIPLLRKALKDSVHYSKPDIELALARFGDKELQSKIIKSFSSKGSFAPDDWINFYRRAAKSLIYISTQESIFQLNNWLDTSQNFAPVADQKPTFKTSFFVLQDLKKIILNQDFQEIIQRLPNSYSSIKGGNFTLFNDNELILVCKKWLIKNKNLYRINREYSPY